MIIADYQWPPNYAELVVAFPAIKGIKAVYFCYGDTIYNPAGRPIAPEKIIHEQVHEAQQAAIGVKEWWRRYIDAPAFRLAQEIPAYQAEYKAYCQNYADKNARSKYLNYIATDLATMYGIVISKNRAANLIRND